MVRDVVAVLDPPARRAGVEVRAGTSPVVVSGDRLRIREALLNLVSSTIEASASRGVVAVALDAADEARRVARSVTRRSSTSPRRALRAAIASAAALSGTVAACGGDTRAPSPPAAQEPVTPAAERSAQRRADDRSAALPHAAWYEVALPADAARVELPPPEGDAVEMFLVDPIDRVAIGFYHPMPRHEARDEWDGYVDGTFGPPQPPTWRGSVDGVPARVAAGDRSLRWTLIVDGFGVLVTCLAEEPRAVDWLRERCEPVVDGVRFVRPLTSSVAPPRR